MKGYKFSSREGYLIIYGMSDGWKDFILVIKNSRSDQDYTKKTS